ncbi:putative williams-beuren syndrome chromosome region [Teratosphaeria destructans]|uniref:Williams-beuren syndrome chromosome region n=1 Tax=Teratosphaeria destructans TaxID=418781 RepID=A0A9W7SNF8_9PEZI|nr:putative williams-beuren syndrome chromosome region [Teratosphaeria destructans]
MTTITQQQYLTKARDAKDVDDCMSIYDRWAETYNSEVNSAAHEYVAPLLVAQASLTHVKDPATSAILDAGCGTGLVGEALALGGAKVIDGIDFSAPMLQIARQTGVYRALYQADLTKAIDTPRATYDVVTCVGTFTSGHVGPAPALEEFIRVLRTGGTIVATVLEEVWEPFGFPREVARLTAKGVLKVVSDDRIDYVRGRGDKAVLLILEKL